TRDSVHPRVAGWCLLDFTFGGRDSEVAPPDDGEAGPLAPVMWLPEPSRIPSVAGGVFIPHQVQHFPGSHNLLNTSADTLRPQSTMATLLPRYRCSSFR